MSLHTHTDTHTHLIYYLCRDSLDRLNGFYTVKKVFQKWLHTLFETMATHKTCTQDAKVNTSLKNI